jgi:RNA polymerase sigma factor (sigma-70 family)
MKGDWLVAAQALQRAEALFEEAPARARRSYAEGVETLGRYRLDPETLHLWAREVVGEGARRPLPPPHRFDEWDEHRKVGRILGRLVGVLGRERDRLVLPNLRLVLKEVFRYRPVGMRRSDLFGEGILGLYKATFRFDARRGVRFSTYATFWIRQSIRKGLTDRSRLIRVPQAIQEEFRRSGGKLTKAEVDRVRRLLRSMTLFSSVDSEDSRSHFAYEIPDPSLPEHSESLRLRKMPLLVRAAMARLDSKQRDVLQRRFGLDGERPETLEQIGVRLNLSRERIRQIEAEAILAMRHCGSLREAYEDLQDAGITVASARG